MKFGAKIQKTIEIIKFFAQNCIFFLKKFGSYEKIAIFAPNSMLSGVRFGLSVRGWAFK